MNYLTLREQKCMIQCHATFTIIEEFQVQLTLMQIYYETNVGKMFSGFCSIMSEVSVVHIRHQAEHIKDSNVKNGLIVKG